MAHSLNVCTVVSEEKICELETAIWGFTLPVRDVTLAYLLAMAKLSGPCLLAGGHFRRWLNKVAARYVCGWLLVAGDQMQGRRQLFSNAASESKRRGHTQLTLITSSRIGFGFWRFLRSFFFFLSLETITTVSLLTFYSNTLMALFILMACHNPISGDLSLFLMASASHFSILQAASDEDAHAVQSYKA